MAVGAAFSDSSWLEGEAVGRQSWPAALLKKECVLVKRIV